QTVTYSCKPGLGPVGSSGTPHQLSVDLTVSNATPSPSGTVPATVKVAQVATDLFITATESIAATDVLTVEGEVAVSPGAGSPLVAATPIATAATTPPAPGIPKSGSITLPAQGGIVTIIPTAIGTVGLEARTIVVKVGVGGAAGTAWYTCELPTIGALPAKATLTVKSPTAASTDDTTTPTSTPTSPTPTPTTTTPKPTHTVFETVTNKPKSTQQVTRKPVSGAATGGGGDAGPDGRTVVLVGAMLVVGAGAGGLMMRRRRSQG
ncbi:MAG: hypothetical protein JWQ95_6084, partial [Sphaerisporangium sp.]|nr:hypothetical protein [Sphaerisporangium sp.]